MTWYLCAYTRHDEVPLVDEDGIHLTLEHLRVIEPDELEVVRGGTALFADLLDRQPLASVLTSRADVDQAVARCLQGDNWGEVHAFLALKKEFKDWLAALRSFDDRTSKWLSRKYGRGAELNGFKRMLSSEYDANFAYRFACALRNVSEHVDDVLTVAHGGATALGGGRSRKRITLGWDGTALQAKLPTLKAAVRAEAADDAALISMVDVVDSATESCKRVYAGLVNLLWPHIEPHVAAAYQLHQEALEGGGEVAYVGNFSRVAKEGPGSMELLRNRNDQAIQITANRVEGMRMLSKPWGPWTAASFRTDNAVLKDDE